MPDTQDSRVASAPHAARTATCPPRADGEGADVECGRHKHPSTTPPPAPDEAEWTSDRRYGLLTSPVAAVVFALTIFLTTVIQALWNPILAIIDGVDDWGLRAPAPLMVTFVIIGCLLQAAAFLVADRAPRATVFLVVAIYVMLAAVLQVPTWVRAMYVVIAASLFLLSTRLRAGRAALWAVGVILVCTGSIYVSLSSSLMTPTDAAVYIARELPALAAPIAAGTALGLWWRAQVRRVERAREEAARAEQEHDRRVDEAQRAERTRIAQELHDVAGQHLAGLIALAEAASTLVDTQPQQALALVAEVKNEGRFAAASVTGALSDLRATGTEAPQRTADLRRASELADYWDRLGMPVRLDVTGRLEDVPVVVSSTAYRSLQEALTNVAKHASRAPVTVRIDVGSALEMSVENAAPSDAGPSAPPVGLGWGLEGMRERALLLRGTLTAGPTAEGGWIVHLRIPLADGSPRSEPN